MRVISHYCTIIMLMFFCVQSWAQRASADAVSRLKEKVAPYITLTDSDSEWLASRLQMYWNSHARDVYIDGDAFHHAGGKRAPVPTVKMDGSRWNASLYNAPRIEDIIPYDDDEASRVTFISKETGKMGKAHPSQTGRNIDAINRRILSIAKDASTLYASTADKRYAELALHVFDTYMKGIYYRNTADDIHGGGGAYIAGMATFEVIHEDILLTLLDIYANIKTVSSSERMLYEATFKKWADVIIDHGVPNNNWNLFQAVYIARVAVALGDNADYPDNKGRGKDELWST